MQHLMSVSCNELSKYMTFVLHSYVLYMLCECRTAVQERQFETICTRLLNAKKHVVNAKDWVMKLKSDKPKVVSLNIL